MNTETQDANTVVESSPTTEVQTEVNIPSDGPERQEWLKSGTLPAPKADSAPAKETSDAPKGESAPASEAGKDQKPRDNAETRLKELLADLKQAGLSPAELKTFKREAQKQTQAESSPAKQPEVKAAPVQELKPPVKPKVQDFESWEAFEEAKDKWAEEMATYTAKKAVQDDRKAQAEAQQTEKLTSELTAARERYKDFDTVVAPLWQQIATDKEIHPVVQEFVGRSTVMVDLMYAIGGDAETMSKFIAAAKTDPFTAMRYAMEAERLVMAELSKTKEGKDTRNDKGQFQASDKKITKAPPPPSEVTGSGTPPADEAEEALKSGDTRRYMDLENERALKSRRATR